jgi:hypothetical protein
MSWVRILFSLGAISTCFLNGCAAPTQGLLDVPATTLSVLGTPPAVDERARFRRLFCEVLTHTGDPQSAKECDEYLWPLPQEPIWNGSSRQPSLSLTHSVQVLIVGGAFGDCFPPASTPFEESVERLRGPGLSIDYISSVSGTSSSEHNSTLIAKYLSAMPSDSDRPLILIGYSKGVADILESLADKKNSDAAARVSAVVSIAGAVNGSPLAERYASLYNSVFARLVLRSCPPGGDGGVVQSLERSRRLVWLASHALPPHIRYYSVATFTSASQTARVLGHTHRLLSRIDQHNDGQLLAEDEVIPGSALLGYANADHWAIALRMEDRFPYLAHRTQGKHAFPQYALLDSILQLVQEDLEASAARGSMPRKPSSEPK